MNTILPTNLPDAFHAVRAATDQRLLVQPQSPFYGFASRELDRIAARMNAGMPFDEPFYDGLNIGLMCARELEGVDMPYCDLVYRMLTLIKQQFS